MQSKRLKCGHGEKEFLVEAVILAGGFGSRLGEETINKPKPMVEIGGIPILIHIMRHLSLYGVNRFVIALGYKGEVIKEYFSNLNRNLSDIKIKFPESKMIYLSEDIPKWEVTLIDTGLATMTGGRLKRVIPHLEGNNFIFTYGDGLSDINIEKLINFHEESNFLATVSAVHPMARFGALKMEGNIVKEFQEKPLDNANWINGGFFILNKKVSEYLLGENDIWESQPLEQIAKDGHLQAFKHEGFWHSMDTPRDKVSLEEIYAKGEAPWTFKH